MTVLTVKRLRLAVVLLVLAVPGACGGGTAATSGTGTIAVRPATGATGSATLPSGATLRTYFDGIARGTLSSLEKARGAAVPGSGAAGYATYLDAAAHAVADSGQEVKGPASSSAEVTHGDYRFCSGKGSSEDCYRYSDITGADGKVVDFSVNGKPVTDRIAVGTSGPVPATGVDARAEFVAAFEATATDDLFVAVRIEATVDVSGVHATYAASGGQSPSSRMAGPRTVHAGAAGSYVFAFPKAALGGTLTLTMRDNAATPGLVVLPIS